MKQSKERYLWVVKFQRSFGFIETVILIDLVHRVHKINGRALGGAKHETDNPTALAEQWVLADVLSSNLMWINKLTKNEVWNLPWVCGNCGPCIINWAFENLTADGNNIFDDVHMQPDALCLGAHDASGTKSSCYWFKKWLLKKLLRWTWTSIGIKLKKDARINWEITLPVRCRLSVPIGSDESTMTASYVPSGTFFKNATPVR